MREATVVMTWQRSDRRESNMKRDHRAAYRRAFLAVKAFLSVTAVGAMAHASGLEIPEIGALGLGRGGAVVANPMDPSTLAYNPAGILGLPGLQVSLGSNLGSFSQCFQRFGGYRQSNDVAVEVAGTRFATSNYAAPPNGMDTPYPQTCANPSLAFAPNLGVTYRVLPNLAFGIGAFPPHTTGREGVFPDQVMTANGPAPSPARHLLYEKRLFLFYPSFTAAFAPVPWLRLGGSLQVGFASFEYATHLNPLPDAAQSPDSDIKLTLRAGGTFVTGNAGIQVILPRYFTFGAKFQYMPELNIAGIGGGTAEDMYYSANAMTRAARTTTFDVGRLIAQPPWHLRTGLRFAMPRAGRPDAWTAAHALRNTLADGRSIERSYDPMRDDAWDLEVDFNYEQTSLLSQTALDPRGSIVVGGGVPIAFREDLPGMPGTGTRINIRSDFRNTMGVRVGGDWNVIPDRWTLRAGFSAETGASSPGNSQIHLPTYDSFSAHFGTSFRHKWFTVNFSYAHVYFVPYEDRQGARYIITTLALDPNVTDACPRTGGAVGGCDTNRARYSASMDLVAINFSGRW
ncbi:MAG: hypothetical protein Q8Q09_17555 [Deltaproteobacteria bacterium]|nr:hypothetical protein [Deltaproteobacteria bacterium]